MWAGASSLRSVNMNWKSRKLWLAVFGVIQAVVLQYFEVPDDIWQAVVGWIMVLITGIAIEDAGAKAGGGGILG